MGIADVIIVALIVGGVGYLAYRNLWRKKSLCAGCEGCSCSSTSRSGSDSRSCH